MTGKIKMLAHDRGFGFIASYGGDFFFHRSDLAAGPESFSGLSEHDRVRFDEVIPEPPRGRRATGVELVEAASAEEATDQEAPAPN